MYSKKASLHLSRWFVPSSNTQWLESRTLSPRFVSPRTCSRNIKKALLFSFFIFSSFLTIAQQPYQLDVNAKDIKGKINPNMWGIFFEDINLGADGGIYAELIKNRSFEFNYPLMGWKKEGKGVREGDFLVLNRFDNENNPRFLRVKVNQANEGDVAFINEGFRGMGVKEGIKYTFSTMYRQKASGIKMLLELLDDKGQVIGQTYFTPEKATNKWEKQSASFTSSKTALRGKFRIKFIGSGTIDLDMLSVFPEDTWKNRPGGLRADMVQMLADMKPGFLRFPGGCIVEGYQLSTRYQWKKTVGPVEDRHLIINRWNTEFAHRLTPDYFQSFGLGFFEYFQLAEDIGAEPLPILNCGMACQFNSAELVPLEDMQEYIQDALDLIEFANGPATSTWGKVRAEMGHPLPFNMKMMGVGNENWGPQYLERAAMFEKAIKEKYPEIQLVYSSGTDPDGGRFDLLNNALRKNNADIIDEHYYRSPEWFMTNVARYDNYDRNESRVFAGEYAGHVDGSIKGPKRNNWQAAIAEAAFLTGLERNGDVVSMASYAPLFAHVDGWQWAPNLIWVDNLHVYGTPSYYVQKLYSLNKGTDIIPVTNKGALISGEDHFFSSATLDTQTGDIILKVINLNPEEKDVVFNINGVKSLSSEGNMTVLKSNDFLSVNSIEEPLKVAPQEQKIKTDKKKITTTLPANSFVVIRCKYKS